MAKDQPPMVRTDPRVLVVEDEPRLRELLAHAIGGWGFDVGAVRSGEEALRAAAQDPPDIVLLDLNLPGMDGIECFRRLRERQAGVQGIVLTGFASLEAARQAIHLDVVEFLTKPAPLGELEHALDRAMRRLKPEAPVVLAEEAAAAAAANDAAAPDTGETSPSSSAAAASRTLEEVERDHILAALRHNDGNRTATAAQLGISRRTLYYKLSEYQKHGYLRED